MPLLGTALGAGAVFFLRQDLGARPRMALLGFASGVMLAASVWSLLLPAGELAEQTGQIPWLACLTGFVAGALALLWMERLVPEAEDALMLAVTLHNVPEGMAVGVALAAMCQGLPGAAAGAMALSFGIAVQNLPEGAVISLPLGAGGMGRGRAFFRGVLSGAVEPVGTLATVLLVSLVKPLLPMLLAFAAGAMVYVVVEELIPQAKAAAQSKTAVVWTVLGFALMMTLDMALG